MSTGRVRCGIVALTATLALAAIGTAPSRARAAATAHFALTLVGGGEAQLLHGTPGSVVHGAVNVRNLSAEEVTVALQPADIRTGANGYADYQTTNLALAGRWITLEANSVRLAPHAGGEVAFAVAIPRSTQGASHYAGIVAIDQAELAAAATKASPGSSPKGHVTIHHIDREAVPLVIRIPGPLIRSLALHTAQLGVQAGSAVLTLGMLPGGTDLIQKATIDLRVVRGSDTIFRYSGVIGQIFPGSGLNYAIHWKGKPTTGSYQVVGVIRPEGAPAVNVDRTVQFTSAKAVQLERETPPVAAAPTSIPWWVWLALTAAGVALLGMSAALWRSSRRRPPAATA